MTDQNTASAPPRLHSTILVYTVVCASMLLSLIPALWAAAATTLLLTAGMFLAYVIRMRAEKDSLTADHMTYIIRTVKLGMTFALLTIGVASVYMLCMQNVEPLMVCANGIIDGGDMSQISVETLQPCIENYLVANKFMLIVASAIGILPILIYFIYRFTKGFSRALKGYRVSTPKEKMAG